MLTMSQVDGSENSETIPLRPLVIPERKVDFIIAYDSSGEEPANSWVNGTTFGRNARAAKDLGFPFPEVPDATTFVNLELNKYPVSLPPFNQNLGNTACKYSLFRNPDLLRLQRHPRQPPRPLPPQRPLVRLHQLQLPHPRVHRQSTGLHLQQLPRHGHHGPPATSGYRRELADIAPVFDVHCVRLDP